VCGFQGLAREAGWHPDAVLLDEAKQFALHIFRRKI
jgi:hypothetical protein